MKKIKSEHGMVIVEATFVFPIMFLVIFFMIFMGNAYYVRSKVEALVTELAVKGAAYCANPMLSEVSSSGKVPAFDSFKNKPYRHLVTKSPAEELIENELKKKLGDVGTGLFAGMLPSSSSMEVKFENKYIYSTFYVSLDFKIRIPVRMLFSDEDMYLRTLTHAETAVSDVPEFMRNINMVEDYMIQTGLMEKISDGIEKAKSFFSPNGDG